MGRVGTPVVVLCRFFFCHLAFSYDSGRIHSTRTAWWFFEAGSVLYLRLDAAFLGG